MARFDCAVVGAGVLGLAHAYHLAKRGLRVAVLERHPKAAGASVRNFGMLWPIGQPLGHLADLANRSVALWKEIAPQAGFWLSPCGSLHLAYACDEEAVLEEFLRDPQAEGRGLELLDAAETIRRFPAVRPNGLKFGLFSPNEACIDPRQAVAELPAFLEKQYGVAFFWNTVVQGFEPPRVRTNSGHIDADRLVICTGSDYLQLYPDAFAAAGLTQCKLQMLRTPPLPGFRLGTHLAAGLTLRHYKAFADCPTLPALAARFDRDMPEYGHYGIHVMASQNHLGELVVGDSHEYADSVDPFDKERIDALILTYLRRFLNLDEIPIAGRWHGVYAKHPSEAYLIRRPAEGVLAVTGVGGAGMTLSFGLAELAVRQFFGESA